MAFAERAGTHEPEPGDTIGSTEASADACQPTAMPPELATFLKDRPFACLTHPTDQGTVLVIKAPGREIESVRGGVRIGFQHELYDHPTAPVIRMVTTIFDQPDRPLALETFINVADPEQRSDYEAFGRQEQLLMLFFDERLVHRLTKTIAGLDAQTIGRVLARADRLLETIDQFDFDLAKADVMEATSL